MPPARPPGTTNSPPTAPRTTSGKLRPVPESTPCGSGGGTTWLSTPTALSPAPWAPSLPPSPRNASVRRSMPTPKCIAPAPRAGEETGCRACWSRASPPPGEPSPNRTPSSTPRAATSSTTFGRDRFGARLRFSEDIQESCQDCAVPVLLLQPLVENEVKHGIAGLVEGGAVRSEEHTSEL